MMEITDFNFHLLQKQGIPYYYRNYASYPSSQKPTKFLSWNWCNDVYIHSLTFHSGTTKLQCWPT